MHTRRLTADTVCQVLATFAQDAKKTPALRAGTVDPSSPYRFALPPKFREGKVANILSGNYCQPRCDEPWTEVIFESAADGKIVVIVSPLVSRFNYHHAVPMCWVSLT